MTRWLALTLVCGMALNPLGSRAAFACSADETFDPVAESDVIIGGRITGYDELPVAADRPPFVPVRLHVESRVMWKGASAPDAVIIDGSSLEPLRDAADQPTTARRWIGAGGACGAFDEDPTGAYVVLGLRRAPDGTLRTNRLMTFYIGREAPGASSLAKLNARLGLPVAGGGGGIPGTGRPDVARLALEFGLMLLLVGALVRSHTARASPNP